jgi:hypothetical protein
MMISTDTLVAVADLFRTASGGMRETTLSHRMFGDSKKLSALRESADITVGRFNAAMCWMAAHWPEGHAVPDALRVYATPKGDAPTQDEDAA